MVHLRAMILVILGLLFVVACGRFEPLAPLEDEGGPGAPEGLKLDAELVNQFSQRYLGDESGLLRTLGVEVGGEAEQTSFFEDLDSFPTDRYQVMGMTVTKFDALMPTNQVSTGSQTNAVSFEVKVLIKVGDFYRALTFNGGFSRDEEVVGGAFAAPLEECFPNGCDEVSGISISQAGLAALSSADLAELIATDKMQEVADRFRPIAAYASCGTDKSCENVTLLLQFVNSDENDGVMPESSEFKISLMSDVKAGFVLAGEPGVMSIAHSSVGPVSENFDEALGRAQSEVGDGSNPQDLVELSSEEQARLAAVEACVRGKIEEAGDIEISTEMADSFNEECSTDRDQSRLDELLAEAMQAAAAEVDPEKLQMCVAEAKARAQRDLNEEEIQMVVNDCKAQILREEAQAAADEAGMGADPGAALPQALAAARQALIDECLNSRISGSNTAQAAEISASCEASVDRAANERADGYLDKIREIAGPCLAEAANDFGPASSSSDMGQYGSAIDACENSAIADYKTIDRESRVAELALLCAAEESEAV
ncbi:MAG: hypothetical protein AAF202_07780, partial [Pseudomonadota bacterium]